MMTMKASRSLSGDHSFDMQCLNTAMPLCICHTLQTTLTASPAISDSTKLKMHMKTQKVQFHSSHV